MKPRTPIDTMAYTIPSCPKIGFIVKLEIIWEIIPNPGKIRIYTSG